MESKITGRRVKERGWYSMRIRCSVICMEMEITKNSDGNNIGEREELNIQEIKGWPGWEWSIGDHSTYAFGWYGLMDRASKLGG